MLKILGLFDTTKKISFDVDETIYITDKNLIYYTQIETFTLEENKIYFSGNIYNKSELASEFNISYNSVSELILRLFLDYNFYGIKQLNGEYTFLIITKFETYIFRDKNGCDLPIYFNDKYFSSSFNYLIEHANIKKEINYEAIINFLGLGYIPSPLTPIKHIKKLAAGSFLIYKHGVGITESKLYDFENFNKNRINIKKDFKSYQEEYKNITGNSIQKRISENNNFSLIDLQNIYSHFYPESEKVILNYEIDKNKIIHHEINYLPEIINLLEIPFNDQNLFNNFLFYKKNKAKDVKYILSFNGIICLFGSNAVNIAKYFKYKEIRLLKTIRIFKKIISLRVFDKNKKIQYYKILMNRILNIYNIDRNGFNKKQLKKLLKSDFTSFTFKFKNSLPVNSVNFEESYNIHNYFIDIKQNFNEIEAFQMNLFSQYFKIPISYVFMDNDIYDFVKSLPIQLKVKGDLNTISKNKGIAMYLHQSIFKTKSYKSIYFHNVNQTNYLYDINLRKKLYTYIFNSELAHKLFNNNFLDEFFKNFEKNIISKRNNSKILYILSFQFFNLLIMTNWWDQYICNKTGKTLKDFI